MTDEMKLNVLTDGPEVQVILALNNYISLGDHVGEGFVLEGADGVYAVCVPINKDDPADSANWWCLEARLQELQEQGFPVTIENGGSKGIESLYTVMLIKLKREDFTRFTDEIKAKPGPLGWGSERATLIKYGLVKEAEK